MEACDYIIEKQWFNQFNGKLSYSVLNVMNVCIKFHTNPHKILWHTLNFIKFYKKYIKFHVYVYIFQLQNIFFNCKYIKFNVIL